MSSGEHEDDVQFVHERFGVSPEDLKHLAKVPSFSVLVIALRSKVRDMNSLKEQMVLQEVNSEHKQNVTNRRVLHLEEQLSSRNETVKQFQEKTEELQKDVDALREANSLIQSQVNKQSEEKNSLVIEKQEMNSRIADMERKLVESQNLLRTLHEEKQKGEDSVRNLQQQMREMEENQRNFTLNQSSKTLKEELYLQEKNALVSDIKLLQDETRNMSEELKSSRESQNILQEQVTSLKVSNSELQKKYAKVVHESQTKLRDEGSGTSTTAMEVDNQNDVFNDLQKELEAQQRLTTLWESQCSELKSQLNKSLNYQSTSEDLDTSSNESLKEQLETSKNQLKVANETINNLQSEVDKCASELQVTKERKEVSPTGVGLFSSIAQKLSASQNPEISFTKVYSDNMRLQQAVLNLQQQLDRANDKICWFFYQIKQRVPIFQQQREEIARNNVYMIDMSEQLSTSKEIINHTKQEFEGLKLQHEETHLRLMATQVQCRDLTREVQCLLLQLDHMQGAGIRDLPQNIQEALDKYSKQPSGDELTMSVEIPNFTSVQDALRQVLQLRENIRALECNLEIQKKASEYQLSIRTEELNDQHEHSTNALQNELKLANTKMENFVHERSVLKEMLNMYKEKLAQSVSQKTSTENGPSQAVDDIEKQLEMYRSEMVAANESLSKRINDLISQLEQTRKEANKVKYREQLSLQRLNVSRQNVDSLRKEMNELKSLNGYLQEVLNRQDSNAGRIYEEHIQLKSLCSRMNSEIANLTSEKEVFGKIQQRLTSENDNLLAERERLTNLVSNLQSLLNEQQRIFSLNKISFETKNKELEEAINTLQDSNQKLENSLQLANELTNAKDIDIDSLRQKLDEVEATKQEHLKVKDSLELENRGLQSRISSEINKVEELQRKLSHQQSMSASERETELSSVVFDLKTENSSLQTSLNASNDNIKRLEEASRLAEETLEKLQREYQSLQLSTSKQLKENTENIKALEKRSNELEEKLIKAQQQHHNDNEQKDGRISVLIKENEQLTTEITDARNLEKKLLQKQRSLQQEVVKLSEDCRKAHDAYEKELLRHANAMSSLQKLRTEYESVLERTSNVSEPTESNNRIATREITDTPDLASTAPNVVALRKQNALLLAHIQTPTDPNSSTLDIKSEKLGFVMKLSLSDLQTYVKQMFNEVSILTCQKELTLIENKRLKKLVEQSNQIIIEFQSTQEVSTTEMSSDGTPTDNNLPQMVKLLNDSNKFLRKKEEEHNDIINKLQERVNSLERDLEAQLNHCRELENEVSSVKEITRRTEEDNQRLQQHNQQILYSLKENKVSDSSAEASKADEKLLDELRQNIEKLTTELNSTKETIEKLESEKTDASNTIEQLTARSKTVAAAWRSKYDQLVAKSLEKHNQVRQQLSQKTSELESKIQETNTLRGKLQKYEENGVSGDNDGDRQNLKEVSDDSQRAEYISTQQRLVEATAELDATKKEALSLRERIGQLDKEKSTQSAGCETTKEEVEKKNQALKQAVLKLRSRITQEVQKNDAMSKQFKALEVQLEKLRESSESQTQNAHNSESSKTSDEQKWNSLLKEKEDMLSGTFQIVFEEPFEKIVTSSSDFPDAVKREWKKRQEGLLKKIQEETKQSHERQISNLRTELEMRSKLKLSMLEKNLAKVRAQLQESNAQDKDPSVKATQSKDDEKSSTITPKTNESTKESNDDQANASLKRPRSGGENEVSSSAIKKSK
ncbi:medial ring protein Alm1 [Schizosaccharomyces octosporus yFS286]|uniref:Medial ring protein Alm1 n=1 Tax=Schizosaccharomyces octosporus (strain yFS286) TaxID=483514 RepID=S9PTT7_SCHOY|nr:medial ring protein Alm1 [Schizosaccharomyces octosporus yFS286]EPX71387.1 medial ring protein Alm1 [Schizosaccharomyces octosporus yFS286]